jgi:HSP20 family protein
MQREMQRFMEHVSGKKPSLLGLSEKTWKPLCDVFETENQLIVVVDLAGISPTEVDVTIQSRKLTLKGERKEIPSPPKKDYHQMEIPFGPFFREIELPEDVDGETVNARYRDGFLIIECNKKKMISERRVPLE